MKKKKGAFTLYNVILPIWLLWIFPHPLSLALLLGGNFIIDFAVLLISMKAMKVPGAFGKAGHAILKTWGYGFAADFIAIVPIYIVYGMNFKRESLDKWWYHNMSSPLAYNPLATPWAFMVMAGCVGLAGYFIYRFNLKRALRGLDIGEDTRKKLAISLAALTAPYLFLLPLERLA